MSKNEVMTVLINYILQRNLHSFDEQFSTSCLVVLPTGFQAVHDTLSWGFTGTNISTDTTFFFVGELVVGKDGGE